MQYLQIGQPYPNTNIATREGATFVQRGSSFDLLLGLNTPTQAEIADLSTGSRLRYASAVFSRTVWLAIQCGDNLSFDCPINPALITPDFYDEPEANLVQLILCDSRTGHIKSMRAIGLQVKFMQQLKSQLLHPFQQIGDQFKTATERLLQNPTFTTDYIFKSAPARYTL